jgi:hypothetical protein
MNAKTTNYPGIDYSAGQPINRNLETGIRYGIIPANDCNPDALEDIYSNGVDTDYDDWKTAIEDAIRNALDAYLSKRAIDKVIVNGLDDIGDDYQGTGDCTRYEYEQDGYKLRIDGSGDLWVFESPYFTHAQFCSPCAPGACYLRSPLDAPSEANKCYCLGPDWFDGNQAPYPVYSTPQPLNPTPGPWIAEGRQIWSNEKGRSALVCKITPRNEDETNARLIAAAPELLSALQTLHRRAALYGQQTTTPEARLLAVALSDARRAVGNATNAPD